MIIHIVKDNERLSEIIDFYNITMDDLRQNNLHITDFKNLHAGMKLKIPNISSNVSQILNQTEPLVSSYYENTIDEEEETPVKEDENAFVNQLPKNDNKGFFRGVNFVKPKGLIEIPKIKKAIYPHFRRNNDRNK